jgi:two-component system NarL family response regulator
MTTINCLLASDSEVLRIGLSTLLANEPDVAVVGGATGAEQLFSQVKQLRPDVVILGLAPPGGPAIEVWRRLLDRSSHATSLVLLTDERDPTNVQRSLEAGASGYVLHTSPALDVLRAVRVAYAGGTFVDAELTGRLIHHARLGPKLSPREHEVIKLLSDGLTTGGIGERLFLSSATVRTYIETAMRKLDARNRVHAVAIGLRKGLME